MHGEKWGWFREGSCSHCGKIQDVNQEIMCFKGLLLVAQGGVHLLVSPMQPVWGVMIVMAAFFSWRLSQLKQEVQHIMTITNEVQAILTGTL